MQSGGLGEEIEHAHQNGGGQKSENRAARRSDPSACHRAQVDSEAADADRDGRACDPERSRRILMADVREELEEGEGGEGEAEFREQGRGEGGGGESGGKQRDGDSVG